MKLAELYKKEIVPRLKEKYGYKNIFAVPRLKKVTVNVGIGRYAGDKSFVDSIVEEVRDITGQQPVLTRAKKSISTFKVRQGDVVGVVATLRGKRMYDFVEKMIHITFPRVRDFRGISPAKVGKNGNLNIGFKEQTPFPEISAEKADKLHGLEVNLTTTAENHDEGLELFKLMGFPFKKEENK